jgi:hypothetical protein
MTDESNEARGHLGIRKIGALSCIKGLVLDQICVTPNFLSWMCSIVVNAVRHVENPSHEFLGPCLQLRGSPAQVLQQRSLIC